MSYHNVVTDTNYLKHVNIGIDIFLDDRLKEAPTKESKKLIRIIKKTVASGKRIRPMLLYRAYQSYDGKNDIINFGVALELLHQALLIHDDIIDEDLTRHNKPNILGIYFKESKNKTYSLNQALLAGDLLYNFALKIVAPYPEISELFNDAFIKAIYGQQKDLDNVDSKFSGINLDKLIKIYRLKTSSYSTVLPLQIAASLNNINAIEKSKLTKLGITLGVYLQLVNDHHDYFSGNELRDYPLGKITYPYIIGVKQTKGNDLKYLTENFGNKNADSSLVTKILISSKVIDESLDLLNKYRNNALADLKELDISDLEKQKFVALIDRIGL